MMQMLISLCGDSDASYLTLMLMLIDLNTDFVHTDLCIRIDCYIILCLFYIHYIQFEIPSVLENQSFGNSNLNNIEHETNVQYSFLFFQYQLTIRIPQLSVRQRQLRGNDPLNG